MAWVEAMPDDPGERDDEQYQRRTDEMQPAARRGGVLFEIVRIELAEGFERARHGGYVYRT